MTRARKLPALEPLVPIEVVINDHNLLTFHNLASHFHFTCSSFDHACSAMYLMYTFAESPRGHMRAQGDGHMFHAIWSLQISDEGE